MGSRRVLWFLFSLLELLLISGNLLFGTIATLEDIVRDLDVPDLSEAALNHLIGYCNIRSLGNVHIKTMNWLKQLEKLPARGGRLADNSSCGQCMA